MDVLDQRYGINNHKTVVYRKYSEHTPGIYNMYLRWYSEWNDTWHMDHFGTISKGNSQHGRGAWVLWNVQSQFDLPMFPKIDGFISRDAAAYHRLTEMRVIQRDEPLPIMVDRHGVCQHKYMHEKLDKLEAELEND